MTSYLLCRDYRPNGTLRHESIATYSASEVAEVFTNFERMALAHGEVIEHKATHGGGKVTFIDMLVVARAAEAAARGTGA